MKINTRPISPPVFTYEGIQAARINPEAQLRRSVMSCLLWEGEFYESGQTIAERITSLIPLCRPEFVAACAYSARTEMKLRHVPLLLVREMARLPEHKRLVSKLLPDVIQRPDEITEFLAIYNKDKRQPLSAQVKKGLAAAFAKFDEYALAKYNRDGAWKLRDALFLSHAKPADAVGGELYTKAERKTAAKDYDLTAGERLFKRLVDGELVTPDTWEVALSGGADKKATFERLMLEKKLGALAFLRNLRNMTEAGISIPTIAGYATALNVERVLPFRFIAAARAVPQLEPVLEPLMLRCLEGQEKLPGKTALVVDNSGSMHGTKVSARSDMDRSDAACALAILLREVCEEIVVIGFGTQAATLPPRRGFALADVIKRGPGGGTNTQNALTLAIGHGYDRIIVITDEQSAQAISPPIAPLAYFINVASAKNGIGYGPWTHIDGWSEAVLTYVREAEKSGELSA